MLTQEATNYRQAVLEDSSRPSFGELLGIALEAAQINPPLYVSSILGLPWTWIPPFNRYSEFKIVDLYRMGRTLHYLMNVSIPSVPRNPLPFGPPILNEFFRQPTVILQRPDHNGSYTSFPHEAWFFINGIMTNDAVAQINAAYLSYLFHRPITLIQNSTSSFFLDLLECALGKEWSKTTEAAIKVFPVIYDALKSPEKKKVVVIAHSQGTILAAVVLRLLNKLTRLEPALPAPAGIAAEAFAAQEFVYPDEELLDLTDFDPLEQEEVAKLEIYCFANCANRMKYHPTARKNGQPVPWIESFGNENDLVARLGMLSPVGKEQGIDLDGPRYVRPGAWGHLLNQHYLFGITDHQKVGRRKRPAGGTAPYRLLNPELVSQEATPRLFTYINGGPPAPVPAGLPALALNPEL